MSFAQRRRRALARLPQDSVDALLITTQPDLRYLTGFTGSAGALALRRGGVCLFTDGRYAEQAKAEAQGIPVRIESRSALLAAAAWLYSRDAQRCGFDATKTTIAELETMRRSLPAARRRSFFVPLPGPIASLREVKEPEEIATLRKAAGIGDRLFTFVLGHLEPLRREHEIADLLAAEARRLGAEGMSFETIVAGGERSALPHGRASESKLPRRGFVTLDFGVVFDGYCSDMTRTVHLGKPDPERRRVYDSVLEAQVAALARAQPGILSGEVDAAARNVLEQSRLAAWFTHSTGHGVGLEIHEGPRLAKGATQVLHEGMVVTVEPGVYLTGRFGVRIEDMLLVNGEGGELLTHSPKALIEL